MKTDPFDDAIRRKLEGVNPPFQEKNWFQFQRFMGSQGFPPSLWQTPARWLQPALTAAAVTGVLISTIWQYQTTQALTEHVQTLTKTVERMERVQLRLQQSATAAANTQNRVDTVYLTPSTPSGSLAIRGLSVQPTPEEAYAPDATHRSELNKARASGLLARASQQRQQADNGVIVKVAPPAHQQVVGQATASGNRQTGQSQLLTDQSTMKQSQPTIDRAVAGSPTLSVNSSGRAETQYAAEPAGAVALPPEAGRATSRRTGRPGTLPGGTQSAEFQSTKTTTRLPDPNDPTLYVPPVTNQANSGSTSVPNSALTTTGPLATVQPLSPLALPDASVAFAESWQRHLRRVRYRSPYTTTMNTPVAAAEPASPAQHTTPLPVRLRLGVGGDVGTAQVGPGVYAEAIWANRWTVSTGLSQFDWVGDEYSTEKQFTAKTKRDFRRDFPGSGQQGQQGPGGPGRPPELININRTAQSISIPLQVGYRFTVAKQYVITPSVGVNLSVNPREKATYSYSWPMFGGEVRQTMTVERPIGWYSSLTAGVGAERQWGHFVVQLSPVALFPLQESTGNLNALSVGLRGRLFYQF